MGYHNIYAKVTGENEDSRLFHEALGYTLLATLPAAGFKHGKWLDVLWFGKRICPEECPSCFPQSYTTLTEIK